MYASSVSPGFDSRTMHHTSMLLRKRDTLDLPRSGSTPDLRRVRPHYVDSTASRPICKVELRQAGLVVWFVRTCEVLVLYFTILSTCKDHTSGWFRNSGSTPGLAPTLRDVTVLFFRLLLKKTVLSQSEGHLNLLNPRPRGGTYASETLWVSAARVRPPTCVEYGHTT